MFPNPTDYTIRVNYHDFDGNFAGAREVYVSDSDLTETQIDVLDAIITVGADIPVCEDCLTSDETRNVQKRSHGGFLCDDCNARSEKGGDHEPDTSSFSV